jgi:hypothetical protein
MFDDFNEGDIADDYRKLLRNGYVIRDLAADRHDDWRAAVRAKARADKLRLTTNSYRPPGLAPLVRASLNDRERTADDLLDAIRELGFVNEHGAPDLDAWLAWFSSEDD